MNHTHLQKKEYLITLSKEYYPHGDDHYAFKSKKNKWHFGYSNDHSMQHGEGENMILPDRMVDFLMSREKKS